MFRRAPSRLSTVAREAWLRSGRQETAIHVALLAGWYLACALAIAYSFASVRPAPVTPPATSAPAPCFAGFTCD